MAQRGSRSRIAVAAIAGLLWTAAAAAAEPHAAASALQAHRIDGPAELEPRFHTVFLPQLIEPEHPHAGRPYKKGTLFQLDGSLPGGQADFRFRVQAKRKAIVHFKLRF